MSFIVSLGYEVKRSVNNINHMVSEEVKQSMFIHFRLVMTSCDCKLPLAR